jgi:hypothetical protein
MDQKPIIRCEACGVDVYAYPFYVKPAQGMEPAYIFLEDHVYNFTTEEVQGIRPSLIYIEDEKDLQRLGYKKNEDGIYLLSTGEEPWMQGGKS